MVVTGFTLDTTGFEILHDHQNNRLEITPKADSTLFSDRIIDALHDAVKDLREDGVISETEYPLFNDYLLNSAWKFFTFRTLKKMLITEDEE